MSAVSKLVKLRSYLCFTITVITDTATSFLSSFRPATDTEVRRIIMSSPTKSCSLDPWPTFLVREYVDLLTPVVTSMVNVCLRQGHLPDSHKLAIVSPLLKKPGPMLAAAIFVRPSRLLAYFNAPTPDSATVRFDLPGHLFGTASPPIFATLISLWDSSAER